MAQAAMFVAIFFGLAVIWERDVGQLHEGLRGFLLGGGHPGVDLLVTLGWLIVLAAAATRAYPKAIL
jgi:hypothetical protein